MVYLQKYIGFGVIPMSVETTINAQTRRRLTERALARFIRRHHFDRSFSAQIFNFFTDVSLGGIERFLVRHNLSDAALKAYYEAYVKEFYPRPQLEEMLVYA